MNSNEFRKELKKIMPGYKWTVHRALRWDESKNCVLSATGIQTAGFNRLSTLEIIRRDKSDKVTYEAKSAGFGLRSPWLSKYIIDGTLAQALRGLQNHYEAMASTYSRHAGALQHARKKA